MTNSRIALAILAVLSITAVSPAQARKAVIGPVTQFCGDRVCPDYMAARSQGQRAARERDGVRTARGSTRTRKTRQEGSYGETTYLPHPPGCPRRAFCACGAAVKVFGSPRRDLWPVRAWHRFARDVAAPGNVAIERGRSHLFVLVSHVSGNDWLVDDFNSGGHKSRRHVRSIARALIVNPHSSRSASHDPSHSGTNRL